MNENAELRRSKERSPNFPFINLDGALQRAQVVYSHERRSSAPTSAIAKHWGYSESSSGFKQTLGALKSYGLLVDEASPSGRMVRLSDLALRVLLDTRSESPERAEFLRQAALKPAVASEIAQRWPEGLPSDHTLTHFLIFDRGFQHDAAIRVAKILRQNDVHVSSASSQGEPLDYAEESAPIDSTANVAVMPRSEGFHEIGRTPLNQSSVGPIASIDTARNEKIIDPNGLDVTISFSGEPTQETYEFLADYVELRLRQFQRKAARTSNPEASNT
ncbi:hypothetical protein [Burkholderia vietnamiensis]|uniref:hypothetical protein n=1 Tax=Burkholderia vietnamiensis TaxID=60552 RepID=UPI000AA27FE1|nr:hypothetical protein [Burkholderia vietnamiensis]